jgi:peroxiredoxin
MQTQKTRFSPALVVFLLLPLLGIALAVAMIAGSPTQTAASTTSGTLVASTPVVMNSPATPFTLTDLNGESVSLEDYAGRVVFINFWWTGCPPCVDELPEFQRFMEEQGEDGAVVLAVNTAETPEEINTFLTENNINLNNVPVLLDSDYAVMRRYGVHFFPTTYVISPDGIISGVKFGAFTLEELYSYLDSAA